MTSSFHLFLLIIACSLTLSAADQVLPIGVFRKLRAGKEQTIVTYGTSLTEHGVWVQMIKAWFQTKYPGKVKVVNTGVSGQHSAWGLANVKALVCDNQPNLVFIEFAINDAHVRFNMSPESSRQNLDGMVKAVRDACPQADIVLQTMNCAKNIPPKTAAKDRPRISAYYAGYSDYAKKNNLSLIDNYPAWERLAQEDPTTFIAYVPDGVHPNELGIKVISWPNIARLLDDADSAAAQP